MARHEVDSEVKEKVIVVAEGIEHTVKVLREIRGIVLVVSSAEERSRGAAM